MTTTNSTPAPGRARRTLAEQIDRLDQVLDGLAEDLNEAVASAVQQAVHQALAEVLTNPNVLTLLGGAARPHALPAAEPAPAAAGSGLGLGLWALGSLAGRLRALWRYSSQLLVGRGVGAVVGVAVYFAGPWVAGLLTGLAGFASALVVQARLWLGHAFGDLAAAAHGS